MKLIDEKIKALGLTKGQYCEKYGFKFKDFAAKVHTLEAKIEWANEFLKPLGLQTLLVTRGPKLVSSISETILSAPLTTGHSMQMSEEVYQPSTQMPAGSYNCERCGTECLLAQSGFLPMCTAPNVNRTSGICGGEFRQMTAKTQDDADSLL